MESEKLKLITVANRTNKNLGFLQRADLLDQDRCLVTYVESLQDAECQLKIVPFHSILVDLNLVCQQQINKPFDKAVVIEILSQFVASLKSNCCNSPASIPTLIAMASESATYQRENLAFASIRAGFDDFLYCEDFQGTQPLRKIRHAVVRTRSRVKKEREQLQLPTPGQRLDALMAALPVSISFSNDRSCKTIQGNPMSQILFEAELNDNLSASANDSQAVGRRIRYFQMAREIPDHELPLQRAVAEDKVITPMELEVLLPSGRRWWAASSAAPMHDDDGNIVGGVAVCVDISLMKNVEAALRRQLGHAQFISEVAAQMVRWELNPMSTKVEEMISSIFQQLAKLIGGEIFLNFVTTDDSETLRLASSFGLTEEQASQFETIKMGQYVCGHVAKTRERVVLQDVDKMSTPMTDGVKSLGVKAYVGYPLVTGGRLLGTISIGSSFRHCFLEDEIEMVATVCNLISSAVERERLAAELRDNQNALALALNAAYLIAFTWEIPQNRVSRYYSQDPTLKPTGSKPVSYEDVFNQVYLEDRPLFDRNVRAALEHPKGLYQNEFRIQDETGTVRWLSEKGIVEFDEAGKPTRLVGLSQDVTSQREANNQRIASEHFLKRVLDLVPGVLYLVDLKTMKLTFITKTLESTLGYTLDASDEQGMEFNREIMHPDDLANLQRHIERASQLENDQVAQFEFRIRSASGQWRWFLSCDAVFERDAHSQPVKLIGSATDITVQKNAEVALQEADRRKDEFLATLAHELRNPLAPIRNAVQVLQMVNSTDPLIRDVREMIGRQVTHMVRLVDDLLDLSRITRGKVELRKEKIDLADVIQNAIETNQTLIRSNQHKLKLNYPAKEVFVDGDPIRLAQVVANLINNAAKYTPEKGIIEITVAQDAEGATISVKDNGLGIPDDMLPYIFDMFTQVDKHLDRSQGGLGIGLKLVKSLIEMHGGNIRATSDGAGCGSEFRITLPLLQAHCELPSPFKKTVESSEIPMSKRRVLVVDDNRDSALSLAMLLKILNCEVDVAHDGLSALDVAQSNVPDIVFLDIGLPGIDGYEVAKRMRQNPVFVQTKLIAQTGWGQESDRKKSTDAGFDAHLVKPIDTQSLCDLLG